MKVIGSVYGLVSAPRLWYRRFVGAMVAAGWTLHRVDAALLMKYDVAHGELEGICCVHVDDILIGASGENVFAGFKEQFQWGAWELDEIAVCGRRVINQPLWGDRSSASIPRSETAT